MAENVLARYAPAARPSENLLARMGYSTPDYLPATPSRDALTMPTPQRGNEARDYGRNILAQMAGDAPAGFAANTVMGFAASPAAVRAFHGSPHRFDRFDISRAGSTTDAGDLGRGLYFTTDHATAMNAPFAGPGTKWPERYEVDIRARNPLNIEFPRWGADKPALVREALGLPRNATAAEVTAEAQRRGHDSVRLDYSPVNYHAQEWAVFEDGLIDILRRYGLAGSLGGAAAAAGDQ